MTGRFITEQRARRKEVRKPSLPQPYQGYYDNSGLVLSDFVHHFDSQRCQGKHINQLFRPSEEEGITQEIET